MMPGSFATMFVSARLSACSSTICDPLMRWCVRRSRLYHRSYCIISNIDLGTDDFSSCYTFAMMTSKCACAYAMVKPSTGSLSNASSILRSSSFELSSGELRETHAYAMRIHDLPQVDDLVTKSRREAPPPSSAGLRPLCQRRAVQLWKEEEESDCAGGELYSRKRRQWQADH